MPFIVLFLLSSSYPLKIGHLQSTSSERRILAICMGNSSAEIISVPACDNFNGVENAAKLNYDHKVDVFIGGACDLESETVSRLSFRWNKLYISTSSLSTIEREGTTIALNPDGLKGMAKAVGIVYSPTFSTEDKVVLKEFETSPDTIISTNVGIHEDNIVETLVQNARIILVFCELNEFEGLISSFIKHAQRITEFALIYIGNGRIAPILFFDRVMMTLSDDNRTSRRNVNMLNNIFYVLSHTSRTARFLSSVPTGLPECDFDGSLCSNTFIFFTAAVIICILTVPLAIAYYLQRKERELQRMPWRIAYEHLTFEHNDMTGYCRVSTASSAHNSFISELAATRQEIRHGYMSGRKGVQYIHNSAVKVHGSLFLSNCVVDSYWVVKLTDFGLRRILNDKIVVIYNSMTELISIICDNNRPVIVRPTVPEKNEFTMRLLSIMQQCWLHKPQARPALFKIADAVAREFAKDAKGSLIDQMIKMIDEYSENLEEIVAYRTKELETTHAKTEKLLYQIMPK
uniref:Guanylate cyclase n=1 Tax=Heterorhabditis bacteriophora TaxID=37862 RepID=A0A1I7WMV0_HETBA